MIGPRPASAAPVEEAEAFLSAHPEIQAVDIVLTDLNGVGRGKIIRRRELLGVYRDGRHLPGSILGLDITGKDIDATGLVWADGDADRKAWPVPGTLVPMPWTDPPRAQVLLSLHELDGSAMPVDPRGALGGQVELFAEAGQTPVMAFELEFYLLDRDLDAEGRPQPGRLPLTGLRPATHQVYRLDELDGLEPLARAVYAAAEAQGLPLETMISEYAPGQYELTLHHRADPLRAADDLIMLKRLLRGVAARHGLRACFMAKPFADLAGSGMHLHTSLADREGRNIFVDPQPGKLAPPLRHAIAELLERMSESMLVFAPHLNSWRRFAAHSYAPVTPNWGLNNRSVAVRVPAGDSASRRLEHRVAGVDANPYLCATVVLAGMRAGLAAGHEPPAEVTAYPEPTDELAPDWRSAIMAAAGSDFLRDALGRRLWEVFLAVKRDEYARFAQRITAEEYACYLDTV